MAYLAYVIYESSQKSLLSGLCKPPEHQSLPVKQGTEIEEHNSPFRWSFLHNYFKYVCDISLPKTGTAITDATKSAENLERVPQTPSPAV